MKVKGKQIRDIAFLGLNVTFWSYFKSLVAYNEKVDLCLESISHWLNFKQLLSKPGVNISKLHELRDFLLCVHKGKHFEALVVPLACGTIIIIIANGNWSIIGEKWKNNT